ncbi:Mg(2+) transporter [Xylographa bjoerkii]|nr:Mg(2+) transporter [Xylographa bjoerkii]
MDSPSRSEQTRFGTPEADLDDHRNQSPIAPVTIGGGSRRDTTTRRGTANSMEGERPALLQVDEFLRQGPIVARDFEQAIIDDDKSNVDDNVGCEPGSTTPLPKRGLSRRIHNTIEQFGRARDRSPSERSLSPPNSVDAFADSRRRERATTFGSKAPSDLDLTRHRTVSGGSHRRRPTFSNGSIRQPEPVVDSDRPEEDVCFPQPEEPTKEFEIDFDELEEFAANMRRGRPVKSDGSRQRHSFSSQGTNGKIFEAQHQASQRCVPQILKYAASPMGHDFESGGMDGGIPDSICDEKTGAGYGRPGFGRKFSMAEPNRYSFFSSEIEHTIHAPELGDLVMHDESFRELFHLPQEGGAWWLDVMNPSEAELEMFQKAFGIHRLTAEDIERQEIREKVELFKQYYFVCFRSFYQMDKNSDDYLEPVNVYMVVFREGIITFTFAPSPHAADVRKRIGKLRNYINLTADWICYALIDNIVDSFGPVIRSIELETDQIEDQVFIAREGDLSTLLREIGGCRKKVMSLMRLLGGKADVIKGFAKRCNEQHSVTPRSEIGLYLGDVQDHVVTMMSNLGHFEKMLSRSHSNYLAQLSVDHMAQGNRANKVLSKITLIATVLVPLNMISGLFGMNVPVPGRETVGLQWFFGILGVILAVAIGAVIAFKRLKYI